jgi:hypothetical protein
MSRAATQEERRDRDRDYRKHEPRPSDLTDRQIADELGRIEREMRESASKGQAACKEAMNIIEQMMSDLGVPMAKREGV